MTISHNSNPAQLGWRWLGNPRHCLSLGFGCGLSPLAPGTVGTLLGVGLYWLLADFNIAIYSTVVLGLFVIGILTATYTSRALGVEDPSAIVIDEMVGILVACIALPESLVWLVFAFLLFRAFDILKPWPIAWIDRYGVGGIGIMGDDLLAGVYTLVCIQATAYLVGA